MKAVPDLDPSSVHATRLLTRIAADPARTRELHALLGAFCHDSRNLLNGIKMSCYLARRSGPVPDSGPWDEVERGYAELERFIDRLHALCREQPLARVRLPLDLLLDERENRWRAAFSNAEAVLAFRRPPHPVTGSFDPVRLGQALDDFAEWRSAEARPESLVEVGWRATEGRFELSWNESGGEGPNTDGHARVSLAARLLGLPMLTRCLTLHGGTLDTSERPDGAWRARATWPLDPSDASATLPGATAGSP